MDTAEQMWDELEPDDMPGDLQEIAKDRGMEEARYFLEKWGGILLYFPALSTVQKQWRDARILDEFEGDNAGELATQYGVTRRYVYDLIRGASDD